MGARVQNRLFSLLLGLGLSHPFQAHASSPAELVMVCANAVARLWSGGEPEVLLPADVRPLPDYAYEVWITRGYDFTVQDNVIMYEVHSRGRGGRTQVWIERISKETVEAWRDAGFLNPEAAKSVDSNAGPTDNIRIPLNPKYVKYPRN